MALSDDLTRGLVQWLLTIILVSAAVGTGVTLLLRWMFF